MNNRRWNVGYNSECYVFPHSFFLYSRVYELYERDIVPGFGSQSNKQNEIGR